MRAIEQGIKRVNEMTGLRVIEWISDPFIESDPSRNIVAAVMEALNKKRYCVGVRNYFMGREGFFGCGINKKIVTHAKNKNYGLYIYSIQNDLLYELDVSLIIEKFSNNIEPWHNQEMYQVSFNSVGAKNVIESRRKYQNKPEKLLMSLFRENNLPIFYTGSGEQQFSIAGKCPDWKVEGQKKVIEYCGIYWHTEEEIEKRKELFSKEGYKTLIIWEGEEKDISKLLEKVKDFVVEN